MIEDFCTAVIKELGATGVMVLGLGWVLIKVGKELSKPLTVINHEIGEIRDLLKELLTKLDK